MFCVFVVLKYCKIHHRGDEIHSRLSSLNGWMSKWCPQNNIGFIDNWTSFWGRPDLLKRDGLHPSWGGAALLARNMAHSLRVLSHLVRLPGPNPSSFAPPSPCPCWTAFILFYLGPNRSSFASSSQQLFTPLLSNDGRGRMRQNAKDCSLHFYIFKFLNRFFFLQSFSAKALTSVLRMCCKCYKER